MLAVLACTPCALASVAGETRTPRPSPPSQGGDKGAVAPGTDMPLRIAMTAQDAAVLFNAQLLGDLDRPVGDAIKLRGLTIPARLDAKGQLEVDLKGDGKFRAIARQDVFSVTLKGEGEKPKTLNVKLLVFKRDDGTWCYRNITQLQVQIEGEQFSVADANGNGVYNEPGVDGMAWQGGTWLFPLPAKTERWCSATQELTGPQFGPFGEEPAVLVHPAVSHCLDHNIHIPRVVEVAVRQDDSFQVLGIEFPLGGLDDAAGPRVN